MEDILFLGLDDVQLLHSDTIELDGDSPGVRGHGLLDAAVAMSHQQFSDEYLHTDLPAMAAAYLFHLAQDHPFMDDNKRTAVLAALVSRHVNGVNRLSGPTRLEGIARQVAAGKMTR
ncbi:MAG: type II toxin-antitoxin system death-on-curing family toxin [Nitrospiraceae bacterium]